MVTDKFQDENLTVNNMPPPLPPHVLAAQQSPTQGLSTQTMQNKSPTEGSPLEFFNYDCPVTPTHQFRTFPSQCNTANVALHSATEPYQNGPAPLPSGADPSLFSDPDLKQDVQKFFRSKTHDNEKIGYTTQNHGQNGFTLPYIAEQDDLKAWKILTEYVSEEKDGGAQEWPKEETRKKPR